MSQTRSEDQNAYWSSTDAHAEADDNGRAWGWALFSGSMIVLAGAFNIIDGLVAVFQTSFFRSLSTGHSVVLPATSDFRAWGWVAFIVGVLMVLVGVFIYTRATWARWLGIVIAGLDMILQLGFMASYPFWSLVMILVDALVIYGLAVSHREKY